MSAVMAQLGKLSSFSRLATAPNTVRSPSAGAQPERRGGRPLAWATCDRRYTGSLRCPRPSALEMTLEGGFTLQRTLPRRVAGWITTRRGILGWLCEKENSTNIFFLLGLIIIRWDSGIKQYILFNKLLCSESGKLYLCRCCVDLNPY